VITRRPDSRGDSASAGPDVRSPGLVSIVIPTYGEAENLPVLVPRICQATDAAGLEVEVIIVDDNSPDDTRQVCEALSRAFPVRLHVREHERGLSSAVLAGMRLARGEIFVVMDADLSHPPEKIGELVAALSEAGADFVIGSRYVAGGKTDENWGLFRWLNSRIATWLARPLTSAGDPMAGFFALRRETFQRAAPLDPIGYKIGLELLVKCGCRRVAEVPIHFADRVHGQSKLSLREQVNYLRHLKRLYEFRYRNWAYASQFLLVGASGMVIDLVTFALLLHWLPTGIARGGAIWVAMTWNFVLNRNLTFSYARGGAVLRQYVGFCGSCLLGAVVNWSLSVWLCAATQFFASHKLSAAVLGVVAGTAFNFLLCRYLVFRRGAAPAEYPSAGPGAGLESQARPEAGSVRDAARR